MFEASEAFARWGVYLGISSQLCMAGGCARPDSTPGEHNDDADASDQQKTDDGSEDQSATGDEGGISSWEGGDGDGAEDDDEGDLPPGDSLCEELDEDQGTGAEASPRLRDFVDRFGDRGLAASVCAEDYAPFFVRAIELVDSACDDIPE